MKTTKELVEKLTEIFPNSEISGFMSPFGFKITVDYSFNRVELEQLQKAGFRFIFTSINTNLLKLKIFVEYEQ